MIGKVGQIWPTLCTSSVKDALFSACLCTGETWRASLNPPRTYQRTETLPRRCQLRCSHIDMGIDRRHPRIAVVLLVLPRCTAALSVCMHSPRVPTLQNHPFRRTRASDVGATLSCLRPGFPILASRTWTRQSEASIDRGQSSRTHAAGHAVKSPSRLRWQPRIIVRYARGPQPRRKTKWRRLEFSVATVFKAIEDGVDRAKACLVPLKKKTWAWGMSPNLTFHTPANPRTCSRTEQKHESNRMFLDEPWRLGHCFQSSCLLPLSFVIHGKVSLWLAVDWFRWHLSIPQRRSWKCIRRPLTLPVSQGTGGSLFPSVRATRSDTVSVRLGNVKLGLDSKKKEAYQLPLKSEQRKNFRSKERTTVHSVFFPKLCLILTNRFLAWLSSNFQERLLMKYFMPQFIFGVSIFSVVSVFGVAYPADSGSLKAITKCFWSRKVGHINGLFVLEVESGGCIFTCRKNQTNGRKTSTAYSLLKATLPWRWTDAIMTRWKISLKKCSPTGWMRGRRDKAARPPWSNACRQAYAYMHTIVHGYMHSTQKKKKKKKKTERSTQLRWTFPCFSAKATRRLLLLLVRLRKACYTL